MRDHQRKQSPGLANRLLEWVCKEEWLEPIKGDLEEQFLDDVDQYSLRRARRKYWINTFNFLRPFAMKVIKKPWDQIPGFSMIAKPLFRHMRKKPGLYGINVLGLALGLTVVFLSTMWIEHHKSFDNFHQKKDRIYQVMTNSGGALGEIKTSTGGIYRVFEEASSQIPEIESITRVISNWRWPSEQCFKIDENKSCIYSRGIYADSSFFNVFDFKVLAGDPNPLRNHRQIAMSKSLATKLYGEEDPIGKTYKMDNHFPLEVVAIFEDIPANSSLQFEFIAPLEVAAELWGQLLDNWYDYSFITYVSLNNDHVQQVNSKINTLEANRDFPNLDFFLHPLSDNHLYDQFEHGHAKGGLITYVRIIRAFSIFILIISIVNFVNLTTAHSTSRGKEIGVRKIIGAGKGNLQIHFLAEIGFSVFAASLIALGASYLLLPVISDLTNEAITFQLSLELMVQLVATVLGTCLLAGVYPALILSAFQPLTVIKNLQFKRAGNGRSRQVLTLAQIAISSFIILVSVVFYNQLNYLQRRDIGYDTKGIMMLEPTYSHIKNYEAFKNELLSHPQIQNIGVANANLINVDFTLDELNWPGKRSRDKYLFKAIGVDNGLLELLGLNPTEGTLFTSDTASQMILTQSAVDEIGIENVLGTSIEMYNQPRQVVGLVPNFNTESLHEQAIPVVLYPVPPKYSGTFYIRYDPNQTLAALDIIEQAYDRFEPFFDMKFQLLDAEYQKLYEREQIISKISWIVMVLAVIIALMGILGLSIFNVSRKLKEIGLRKVFGASGIQLLRFLSKEFILLTVIANLIALPFTFWFANQWLEGFAYRISFPFLAFIVVFILSLIAILVLLGLQSIKVSQLNPSKILRDE